MLTFFTTCKPFKGANAIAQRNAIQSWLALGHACEVILLGDDEGTAEVAEEFGARHVPDVRQNEYGTPLLDSIFDEAKAVARQDLMCYINADIMLTSDFLDAVMKLPPERLLMISRRWNVNVDGPWDFDDPEWHTKLREHTAAHGAQKSRRGGPDFFVFQRYQWNELPPFALGRPAFDNWLIYAAIVRDYPVIDASPSVMAIHQNHDCGHVEGGWIDHWYGEEAMRNRALATDDSETYSFLDATHLMTSKGLEPAMAPEYMARRHERRLTKWLDRQLLLAGILRELGRNDEALRIIHGVCHVAGTPERPRRYIRAMLRTVLETAEADQVTAFVARLIASEPSPMTAYHVASICQELHVYDKAAALFRAVLTDESQGAAVLKAGASYHLAQIAAEMGHSEAARRYAQMCLAENPEHGAARALLERLDQDPNTADDELIEAVKTLQKSPAQAPAPSPQPADAAD